MAASIFTYGNEPERVTSPWLTPVKAAASNPVFASQALGTGINIPGTPPPGLLADYNITRLEPEPQEGPVEFKLHLLLRPRRVYSSSTTTRNQPVKSPDETLKLLPGATPTYQHRQHRLLELSTQLLWRLQQSSPYHANRSNDPRLPKLPETEFRLREPSRLGPLLAGLEDSRGALYEIGVSDDGTFVGLTEDEMDESIVNLRSMAACLGCSVEVTKMVMVGECEWQQAISGDAVSVMHSRNSNIERLLRHQAQLWVAEALVTPDLTQTRNLEPFAIEEAEDALGPDTPKIETSTGSVNASDLTSEVQTAQLRITLSGPTTSGKSSLLGTLSTGKLDNGRGKSRLNLLKHRHELSSGITSSVAQELFGYRPKTHGDGEIEVVNYAMGNVGSWDDIHAAADNGRLVFVSDSAGHPRYRRTTVRGLMGWAPHWTLLCIGADDGEKPQSSTAASQEVPGLSGIGIDFNKAHLDLCLKLDTPLVIVITKLDLAKVSLRANLAKILSAIKSAGRVPMLLTPDQDKCVSEQDLETISEANIVSVTKVVNAMNAELLQRIVPIIMTSSVKGNGIQQLHALLRVLPLPPNPTSRDYVNDALNPEQPLSLFHIEDVFKVPVSYATQANSTSSPEVGSVIAGYLRFGSLSVGDCVVLGPFPSEAEDESLIARSGGHTPPAQKAHANTEYGSLQHSRSNPSVSELARLAKSNERAEPPAAGEWLQARIVSIRNLRLPVHRLQAGQVGTIGVVFDTLSKDAHMGSFEQPPLQAPSVRKGMVLAIPSQHMLQTGHSLQATSGFTASFDDGDINSVTLGSLVVIYIASIRTTARVIKMAPHMPLYEPLASNTGVEDDQDLFGLESDESSKDSEPVVFGMYGVTDVTLELVTSREWIELGSKVLIMPGGGPGLYGSRRGEKGVAGLEGFVGKVVEVVD